MKRKLKIYEQSMGGGNYTQVPTVLLKGKWLEAAGFKCGEYVEVEVEGDKITLTKTTPPEKKRQRQYLKKSKSSMKASWQNSPSSSISFRRKLN